MDTPTIDGQKILQDQSALLEEHKFLLDQKKIELARKSFKHFCEYVIKDEFTSQRIKLADLQKTWIHHIAFCKKHKLNALILAPMCHAKGQGVLMFDGTSKNIEDIEIGDLLMGPDSTARTVLETHKGLSNTYQVERIKGKDLIVGENHYLVTIRRKGLKKDNYEYPERIEEHRVSELAKRKHLSIFQLMTTGVDFQEKCVPLDPYILGVMLGDGCFSNGGEIISKDTEILSYVENFAINNNLSYRKASVGNCSRIIFRKGYLINQIKDLGLLGTKAHDKFIPNLYKINSINIRLKVLAGLLDTDGSYNKNGNFDFVSKSEELANNVWFIAKSLGLHASISACMKYAANTKDKVKRKYYRVCIGGQLSKIPTLVQRKQAKDSSRITTRTGFNVFPTGRKEMVYGFTVDKDHRYLLDDFTVDRNSSGKCVLPETLIRTNYGLIPAGELDEMRKCTKDLRVLSYDETNKVPVWSSIKQMEKGRKDCVELVFESGRKITTTLDHPFLSDSYEWVEAQDLRPNKDNVLQFSKWEYSEKDTINTFTGNEAYLLGLLVGKGCKNEYRGTFDNLMILGSFFDSKKVDLDVGLYKSKEDYAKDRCRHIYEELIKNRDMDLNEALQEIAFHTRKTVMRFIAGLFDACGNYDTRNKEIVFTCGNGDQAILMQDMFLYCGFQGNVRRRPKEKQWLVCLDKDVNVNFFSLDINKTKIIGKIKFELKAQDNNYVKDKVVTATAIGKEEIISIEVEGSHTFVANDYITHNTQIISVALPLYTLGKNPASRIKLVCLSDDAAKERVTSIKSYIESDPDYRKVFPHVYPGKDQEWTKHKLFVSRSTYAKDASIDAKGIITSGIGGRCDMLLVDDIFDQRTAVSQPATRDQYIATYTQVWLSRVEPNGSVIVICTRWHEKDLTGFIMADQKMMRRYGVLVQRVTEDFQGIQCEVHIPDQFQYLYQKEVPFDFVKLS